MRGRSESAQAMTTACHEGVNSTPELDPAVETVWRGTGTISTRCRGPGRFARPGTGRHTMPGTQGHHAVSRLRCSWPGAAVMCCTARRCRLCAADGIGVLGFFPGLSPEVMLSAIRWYVRGIYIPRAAATQRSRAGNHRGCRATADPEHAIDGLSRLLRTPDRVMRFCRKADEQTVERTWDQRGHRQTPWRRLPRAQRRNRLTVVAYRKLRDGNAPPAGHSGTPYVACGAGRS